MAYKLISEVGTHFKKVQVNSFNIDGTYSIFKFRALLFILIILCYSRVYFHLIVEQSNIDFYHSARCMVNYFQFFFQLNKKFN